VGSTVSTVHERVSDPATPPGSETVADSVCVPADSVGSLKLKLLDGFAWTAPSSFHSIFRTWSTGCPVSTHATARWPRRRVGGLEPVNAGTTGSPAASGVVPTVHDRVCVIDGESRIAGSRTKSVGSTTLAATVSPALSPATLDSSRLRLFAVPAI